MAALNDCGKKMRAVFCLFPLVFFVLAGCQSTPKKLGASDPIWNYWKPHLLLVSSNVHRRLEIEIDAVAGAEPTASNVRLLKTFLEAHCQKPDGITVRLDPVIPRVAAKGLTPQDLSGRYCDGPRDVDSAYCYFLFYDSRLAGVNRHEPFTTRSPFPGAVFIDDCYVRQWNWLPGAGMEPGLMILHEAGHLLGLASNRSHGDGSHCTNLNCIMNRELTVRPARVILPGPVMPQRNFCPDCQEELEEANKAEPPANIRFRSGYAIRSEPLYQVVSSPGFTFIHAGKPESISFELLDKRRREVFQEKRPGTESVFFQFEAPDETDFAELLPALAKDPIEFMRGLPKLIQESLDSRKGEAKSPVLCYQYIDQNGGWTTR